MDTHNPMQSRQADALVEGSAHSLGHRLKLVAKAQVKLWKALVFAMFIAGFASALTLAVSTTYFEDKLSTSEAALPKYPDLTTTPLSWKNKVDFRTITAFPFSVCNKGNGDVPVTRGYRDSLFIQGATEPVWEETQDESLPPGQCYTAAAKFEISLGCNGASIYSITDRTNIVSESNKLNNQSAPFRIEINPVGDPGTPWFTNIRSDSVMVHWKNVASEGAYKIYRCKGSKCEKPADFNFIYWTMRPDVTTFTDSRLSPHTAYSYWVIADGCPAHVLGPRGVVTTSGVKPIP